MASDSKRNAIVFGLIVTAVATIAAAICLSDPIRYDGATRLEVGMTKGQVIALLGCEPGEHGFALSRVNAVYASHGLTPLQWQGSRGTIVVYFSPNTETVSHWTRWNWNGDPVQ